MEGLDKEIMKYLIRKTIRNIRGWIDYIYELYINNGAVDSKSSAIIEGIRKAVYDKKFSRLLNRLIEKGEIGVRDLFYVDKDRLTNDYIISFPSIFEVEICEEAECHIEGIESIRFGESNKLFISTYPISQGKDKNYILLRLIKEKDTYELESIWYKSEKRMYRIY